MKQRLIGAAVLIALAVIFVPMFLSSSPPQTTVTEQLVIPPAPDSEFQTRVVPAEGGKATRPTPAPAPTLPTVSTPPDVDKVVSVQADPNPRVEIPYDQATPAKAGQTPAKPTTPTTPTAPTPATATAGAATSAANVNGAEGGKPVSAAAPNPAGRYMVHLGVFTNTSNVNALVANAKKLGLATTTESAEADGKAATRVRLGPYPDRTTAESARLKFKQVEPKLGSSVVELSETVSADAPASAIAADRAGGWAVQVGAFKAEQDANKLRDRLKAAGFAAFVDSTGAGEERLWRVRAGPEANRAAGEKLRDAIKQKLALNNAYIVTLP